MNKLISLIALCIVLSACGSHELTGPAPIETLSTEVVQQAPVTVAPVEPTPVAAVVNPPAECRAIYNTFHQASEDGLSIVVKNLCPNTFKEYVFALFNVAPDGFQTLIGLREGVLEPGETRTFNLILPFVHACAAYQSDLFVEITIAQVVSGEAKINPNQEGQQGYVNPIYGKVFTPSCGPSHAK